VARAFGEGCLDPVGTAYYLRKNVFKAIKASSRLTPRQPRFLPEVRLDEKYDHTHHDRYICHVEDAGLKKPEINVEKVGYRAMNEPVVYITYSSANRETKGQRTHGRQIFFH
jgi:hypothetical protein